MSFRSKSLKGLNTFLKKLKLRLVKISENDESDSIDIRYLEASSSNNQLPEGLEEIINKNDVKLHELRKKYKECNYPVTKHSVWSDLGGQEFSFHHFRGDNLFLWQYRSVGSSAHLKYILYTYYIRNLDSMNFLNKLKEDSLFGVYLFDFNGIYKVSRDLLDSISEIYFLEKHLQISQKTKLKILDIGAGYGRLAYRFSQAFEKNIAGYYCVDAIPESTYLSDFYLKFRGVDEKAKSIPLFEIESFFSNNKIDLAINIHSFSECILSAIKWWLDLLRTNNVKQLMIIPNPGDENKLLSSEQDGTHLDYSQYLEDLGYKLKVLEPKFSDSSLQELIHHHPVYYYLYELTN